MRVTKPAYQRVLHSLRRHLQRLADDEIDAVEFVHIADDLLWSVEE
jgi:hypothetical protein